MRYNIFKLVFLSSVSIIGILLFSSTLLSQEISIGKSDRKFKIERRQEMELTSSAFENNQRIPRKYTCEGEDVSPPLSWSNVPDGVKSFAIICDDPDAPMGTWVHWVIYNIPADTRELAEGIPTTLTLNDGTVQGINDFRRIGYGGPCPPPGPRHRYFFKLYALDITLALSPKANKRELEQAMQGHILAEKELIGLYSR